MDIAGGSTPHSARGNADGVDADEMSRPSVGAIPGAGNFDSVGRLDIRRCKSHYEYSCIRRLNILFAAVALIPYRVAFGEHRNQILLCADVQSYRLEISF